VKFPLPQKNWAVATQLASHCTSQHEGWNAHTVWQQPISLQNGVACTCRQLPVLASPQLFESQPQEGSAAARFTQVTSHAVSQQNESIRQTRVQQLWSEQLGMMLGTQQLCSKSLPHGGTGQASSLAVQVSRATPAQTLSQRVLQQYASCAHTDAQHAASLQAPLSWARQQLPAHTSPQT